MPERREPAPPRRAVTAGLAALDLRPAPPALDLADVVVRYGDQVALRGVAGRLAAGESMALIGPNGAGKSTLIRAILGLVPAASGELRVFGLPPAEARSRVAYVPQHSQLDPEFPVNARQVVLMGRYRSVGWLRRPGRADRAAADAALAAVGLADRAGARFGTLSGGQRQRVLFARALAQEASLLLLDEPFNGVDAVTQEVLVELLGKSRNAGAAVLLSTHDLDVARHACTEACLLNRRQFSLGPIAEALDADLLLQAFAGGPHLLADHDVLAVAEP
jgi:manganese/iron transport system ATP-binding protein